MSRFPNPDQTEEPSQPLTKSWFSNVPEHDPDGLNLAVDRPDAKTIRGAIRDGSVLKGRSRNALCECPRHRNKIRALGAGAALDFKTLARRPI
ncbi:MAG: hypothetical protein AMJ56_00695 [Anaerolineae bacterium SG8_19]|nr:MAG: hypothetical protein AMJ56_00695 [Anaerolineae bacterium SG8_19]